MRIETIETSPIEGLVTNSYLVADEGRREAIVIDPGGDPAEILARLRTLDLKLTLVVNTHGHFDHIAGNRALVEATGAPCAAHREALALFRSAGGAALFGLRLPAPPEPERLLAEGDEVFVGSSVLRVLHTPGHSPGSISLWSADERVVFGGDVLFREGIGRTDLPGGSYRVLIQSIQGKLLILPEDTVVYPGHGPQTTIGHERQANPFLSDRPEWL